MGKEEKGKESKKKREKESKKREKESKKKTEIFSNSEAPPGATLLCSRLPILAVGRVN